MARRFNNDFMVAYPIHFSEKGIGFPPPGFVFTMKRCKFIRDNPDGPRNFCRIRVSEYFWWGLRLVTWAERTYWLELRNFRFGFGFFLVVRTLAPLSGKNDPFLGRRILTNNRHVTTPLYRPPLV